MGSCLCVFFFANKLNIRKFGRSRQSLSRLTRQIYTKCDSFCLIALHGEMLRLPWITAEPVAVPHRLRQLSRWRRLHGSPNHRFSMVFLLIIRYSLMNTDDIISKFRWFWGYPHTVDPCWSVGWSRNMLMKHDENGWKTLMKHDETGWNLWNPMKMIKLWPWDQSFKSGHWICLYHSHGLWNALECNRMVSEKDRF